MKIKLLIIPLIIALCLSLYRCSTCEHASVQCDDPPQNFSDALLKESEDLGDRYIDSFIFFGESTTYHLKSRGVLRDGVNTHQVWGPPNATVNLDLTTKDIKIIYPPTNEKMTIAQAVEREKPEYIVMTFGLNGAVQKFNKGAEYFKRSYLSLIESIRNSSPKTKIILQSAFPVAKNMDMTNYSIDVKTLNYYIDTINSWSLELASAEGLKYLNTSEILKDDTGSLYMEYQCGDGHHLTTEAYKKILTYIRTHGYT